MIERDIGTENSEQDKPSSAAIIAPNDTEIRSTMTTAESTTATAYISTTTTTTKSTTISTTDVVFLSEKLRSDDENYDENDDVRESKEGDDEEEEEEEEISDSDSRHSANTKCPSIPPNLVGRLKVNLTSPSWEELETTPGFTRLRPGGEFSPADCDPEYSGELAK